MGSVESDGSYSVPSETQKIFEKGILNNDLIPTLPWEIKAAGKHVRFTGNDAPSIPINWRFAESAAALKAFEASMLNVLRYRKYGSKISEVNINTDHASLFVMSPFLAKVIEGGEVKDCNVFSPAVGEKYGIRDCDLHRASASTQRLLATNIYKTKDGRCYHVHGSMNPEPTLTALGMDLEGQAGEEYETIARKFQEVVGQYDSKELDSLMNDKYKQAGTICHSTEEFWQTEHGKANAHVGLYELKRSANQPAAWWPEHDSFPSSPSRPLAGLKVVDLTRVIAAPALTRGLAEMGASVMRVTSPEVTDLSGVHQDLNWGKWTAHLHLKTGKDRKQLIGLIKEADVVVEGYRPGVMEKYGLSRTDIFKLLEDRDRGVIHVKENCYGWNGPWQGRSGWQQISDACCGVSLAYGKAMGLDEAVTPVFPNSDYCTGIAGTTAVLHALIRRAEEGGSFGVDVALNYYSQWLVRSVGEYPKDVWSELWQRHGSPVYRNHHNMGYLLPSMLGLLHKHDAKTLFKPEFFERRNSNAVGFEFVQLKPVAQFVDDVKLEYNVGTRGNGYDKPHWPADLRTEVVA
ncbi:putative CoA-transferase family III [Septoria linicola]|nr:putative CoA-transferase family III [Septoria linicola]